MCSLEHLCSCPVFSGVRVARSLVFCAMFCRSLFVLFHLSIVLSVLRFTASEYPFGTFKLFFIKIPILQTVRLPFLSPRHSNKWQSSSEIIHSILLYNFVKLFELFFECECVFPLLVWLSHVQIRPMRCSIIWNYFMILVDFIKYEKKII